MNPYLDIQNLTKSFGELLLFENLNMSIGEGQRVGLIAKNGTGKSTLLSIINGNEGYDSGDIIFRKGLRVGYLMQSPNFNPDESVLDACFRTTIKEEDDRAEREAKMLKAKQILTKLKIRNLEQPMRELSGGQQKRVALANVLITEPDLLILDEPTNHLDLPWKQDSADGHSRPFLPRPSVQHHNGTRRPDDIHLPRQLQLLS